MDLIELIDAVAETVGKPLAPPAIALMARTLEAYPEALVAKALERCSRECRHRLTLADVLDRIPGGHPGVEEAWAIARQARDEGATVVWTKPMSEAWGIAAPDPNDITARLAFKDAYQRLVAEAPRGLPLWGVSLGHDAGLRYRAVCDAEEVGRLPRGEHERMGLLPPGAEPRLRALPAPREAEPMAAGELASAGLAFLAKLKGEAAE